MPLTGLYIVTLVKSGLQWSRGSALSTNSTALKFENNLNFETLKF